MSDNKAIGEKYGIHPRDVERIKFAFEVYDFKGDGKVDGFYTGDLLRACNLNPTLKTIHELGGESEKGKKTVQLDDVYALFKKAKDSKDTGGFHDFVEILKLYDKNEDSTILENELFRLLTNLGEKLTKEEAKGLMKELCDPADDDGFMPFKPFLERMCTNE
jgi:myosin light chain 6